jgi:hypothetical protein
LVNKGSTNTLLKFLRKFKSNTSAKDIPTSYDALVGMRKKLPVQKPKMIKVGSSEFYYYQMKDHLIRIFGNSNHCKKMHFEFIQQEEMKEFYHTPFWKDVCTDVEDHFLPLSIILYYDKFGCLRQKQQSMGGLYFTLANFEASHASNPDNLFCLGLVKLPRKLNVF